jgi:hypothetical protein
MVMMLARWSGPHSFPRIRNSSMNEVLLFTNLEGCGVCSTPDSSHVGGDVGRSAATAAAAAAGTAAAGAAAAAAARGAAGFAAPNCAAPRQRLRAGGAAAPTAARGLGIRPISC